MSPHDRPRTLQPHSPAEMTPAPARTMLPRLRKRHAVSSYLEDNLQVANAVEDDMGLPESPIYSNYAKHLWKAHTRHGGGPSPNKSHDNTDGLRTAQDQ